jgi:hypothetical protein
LLDIGVSEAEFKSDVAMIFGLQCFEARIGCPRFKHQLTPVPAKSTCFSSFTSFTDSSSFFHRPDEKKLPDYLQATGKYNFNDQNVVLCMYADKYDWSLVSITGSYDFNKTQIPNEQFEEITGIDFVYNITPTGKTIKAKVFKFDASKIDRHVLMKQFTVQISYIFLEDVDLQLHSTKYKFEVSEL